MSCKKENWTQLALLREGGVKVGCFRIYTYVLKVVGIIVSVAPNLIIRTHEKQYKVAARTLLRIKLHLL